MNALLRHYAERIDAATVRQRLLIFVVGAFALLLLGNALLLQPQRAKQKRFAAETAQYQHELNLLQAEVRRLVGVNDGDPQAASRKRAAALRAELESLNSRIGEQQRRFTPPDRMRAVLEEMLGRNKGLSLVDLQTLPVSPVSPAGAPGSARGMYRHGIQITVRGTYAELYEYLRSLEDLPSQLYWTRAELTVTEHPLITLKLTVITISFDRAWLVV